MERLEVHCLPGVNPAAEDGSLACTGYLPASRGVDF